DNLSDESIILKTDSIVETALIEIKEKIDFVEEIMIFEIGSNLSETQQDIDRTDLVEQKIELLPSTEPNKSYLYQRSLQGSTIELAPLILTVLKKDQFELMKVKRSFVIDFRQLNSFSIKNLYFMFPIFDIILCFASSKYFLVFDLNSCFWKTPIKRRDRLKTAFVTMKGLFEYLDKPMGLTNSPANFIMLINKVAKTNENTQLSDSKTEIISNNNELESYAEPNIEISSSQSLFLDS
ncbi:Transposon Ty3-I Gag-Pol polyprotein-like protein, partial [Dinothrombium tinctorium]